MRRRYAKFLSWILVVALLLQPTAMSFAQESDGTKKTGTIELIQEGDLASVKVAGKSSNRLRALEDSDDVSKQIYQGLSEEEVSIDVSDYSLTQAEFKKVLMNLINSSPELFYVGSGYSFTKDQSGYIDTYIPCYEYQGQEVSSGKIAEMKKNFKMRTDEVLKEVDPKWSDREKVLYIHDYLAAHSRYDMSAYEEGGSVRHDAYSLIVEGCSVCQGYALAFLHFMKELGISCRTLASDSMNHMWNQVEIDGEWYHLDVTWDDPTEDIAGRAVHSYFLKSDEGMATSHIWETEDGESCTDTTYDSYFWKNSNSPIVSDGEKWFYVMSEGGAYGIYQWDPVNDPTAQSSKRLVDMSSYCWKINGSSSHLANIYTNLAVYDRVLYFNTTNQVMCLSTDQDDAIPSEVPGIESTGDLLFGLRRDGLELKVLPGMATSSGGKVIITTSDLKTVYRFAQPEATEAPTMTPIVTLQPLPEKTDTPETTEGPGITLEPVPEKTATPKPIVETSTVETVPVETSPAETLPIGKPLPTESPLPGGEVQPSEQPQTTNEPAAVDIPIPKQNLFVDLSSRVTPTKKAETKKPGIRILARKARKTIKVWVPKKTKVVLSLNKKWLLYRKKRCKKITFLPSQTKKGYIKIKTSSKLKRGVKVTVSVTYKGKKYKKTKTV